MVELGVVAHYSASRQRTADVLGVSDASTWNRSKQTGSLGVFRGFRCGTGLQLSSKVVDTLGRQKLALSEWLALVEWWTSFFGGVTSDGTGGARNTNIWTNTSQFEETLGAELGDDHVPHHTGTQGATASFLLPGVTTNVYIYIV